MAVATGVAFGVFALFMFRSGPGPSLALAVAVVALAAVELFAALRKAGYRPATLLGITSTISVMLAAYAKGETAIPLVLCLTMVCALLWFMFGVVRARPTMNVGVTLLGVIWVGFLGSFAALLLRAPDRRGIAFLVAAIVTTVAYDVGALVVGSRSGRTPLAPEISPNKTWEGIMGGAGAALLASVLIVGRIHPWDLGSSLALGLVVAFMAPLGDLSQSLIKRDLGMKDMGTLLPGHGGVMDRFDALALRPARHLLPGPAPAARLVARLAIAGSTGSIGTQALEVVDATSGQFEVVALAAGGNRKLIQDQIDRWRPALVGMGDAAEAAQLELPDGTDLVVGDEVPKALAERADVVLNAVVGYAGLPFTLAALVAGRRLALANKESLVAGGDLVRQARLAGGGEILPVDSEHAALHQCLAGIPDGSLARLLLTASGGPFRGRSAEELAGVTRTEALDHPTWDMGPKVTIDSSTLMNKGLEVIEAHELFDVDFDAIDVVVHPQSIVHSMVETTDGSVLAQLSRPDMRLPIGYALGFPARLEVPYGRIDWSTLGALTFEEPDRETFACLDLAYAAGRSGATAPAWLNAANEVAVDAFLAERIRWPEIATVVDEAMQKWDGAKASTLEDLADADAGGRRAASQVVDGLAAA